MLLAATAGCAGGGGSTGILPPVAPLSQSQQPTLPAGVPHALVEWPGAPSVSPAKVDIVSTSMPVTATVSESGYTGTFVVNASRCATLATATPGSSNSRFTITGLRAGWCAMTFTDSFGQSVALTVTVTTTTGTITIG